MICFNGTVINIQKPLVCRAVSSSSEILINKDTDFLLTDEIIIDNRYAGIISKSFNDKLNANLIPVLQIEDTTVPINDGDILFIEPNGKASKIYDPLSSTNSIFLTERCNSNCLMCPQPPKEHDVFNWVDIALKSIPLMNPATEFLGITGGEPTLEWEALMQVIKACRQYLPDTTIQLLSNARILKDYSKVEELADVGEDKLFVGVPLYSDIDLIHDKLCGSKGAFGDCIEGLYNLARAGIFIELRIVITKANYERLPQFAEFVYRTIPFIGRVAFMAIEPIEKALNNIEYLWIDTLDYTDQLEQAIRILWRRKMYVSLFNHQLCVLPTNLWALARKTISEWKNVYNNECQSCIEKENCGGFFHSAMIYKSRGIRPIA